MTTSLNSSQQYKLLKAELSADRFGDNTLDIRALIAELNLFESLELPYLTGNMLIIDDKALLETLDFQGTERLTLEISSVSNIDEPKIGGPDNASKTFILTKIEKSVRNNDRSESVLISFVEEHFFFNKLVKVSKSFTSNLEGIITEIFVGFLNKNVDISYSSKSAQGVRKINVPYMHPLEAIEWMRDRMTTDVGSPFFTHASLFDNNVRLSNLDGFLLQNPFNERTPFVYSTSLAMKADDLPENQRSMLIEDYKVKSAGDSLMMINNGAIGSLYTNTDLGTGITTRTRFSIRDVLEDFKDRELISDTSSQSVFDDDQFFINKFTDQYDSRVYHQLTSSGTYDTFKDYHDVADSREHVLKLKNKGIRNALYRNMVNMIVPGVAFMYSKISVGDTMRCRFSTTASETGSKSSDDLVDKQKSGKYLIYATRHMFKGTKHSVSINATKLTKELTDGLVRG